MSVLDIFNQDAFSVRTLTDSINKLPFVPGRAGQVIDWNEQGITTTTIMVEEIDGVLTIINPSGRGGDGVTVAKQKRTARAFVVPHYQVDDAMMADEVQNVRAFGSENAVEDLSTMINNRMAQHVSWRLDPTLEYQRLGALKGIILNADGTTLYNLFTEFGVTQEATIDFNLDATTDTGAIRGVCADAIDLIADNLGGITFTGVNAFCGKNFFKSLISNIEVRNTYKNTPMAQVLREGYVDPNTGNKIYGAFEFGGIIFESYRGKNGTTPFVGDDEVRIFPVGTPGLYRTVNAPADFLGQPNSVGLPRYTRMWPMTNGKGMHLEVQSNSLSYCTRPKVLLQGTTT